MKIVDISLKPPPSIYIYIYTYAVYGYINIYIYIYILLLWGNEVVMHNYIMTYHNRPLSLGLWFVRFDKRSVVMHDLHDLASA